MEFDVEIADNETATPFGPLPNEDIAAGAEFSGDALEKAARSYFPWWEEGFGASFYRGLALNALWLTISWSPPADEEEREQMSQVLDWCEKAARLGADPSLPAPAVEELHRLAASQEPPCLPAEEGIGYRRRLVRRPLTGHWSLSVPGALNELVENDGETITFWSSELEVSGSPLVASRREDASQPAGAAGSEMTKRVEFSPAESCDGYVLRLIAEQSSSGNTLHVGIVTIWMGLESLRPVAERIAASIEFRPPQSE